MRWQQVLVEEFKLLWEIEWPHGWLRQAAGWFGFRHIDVLIAELPQAKLDTFEASAAWYRSFLARVGG
jgi:hypothetical protein